MKKYLLGELDGSICSTAYSLQEKDLKSGAAVMAAAFCDDPAIRYLLGGENTGNDDWQYFNSILKSIHAKCVMLSSDNAINDLLVLFPPQLTAVPTIGFLSNGGMNLEKPSIIMQTRKSVAVSYAPSQNRQKEAECSRNTQML